MRTKPVIAIIGAGASGYFAAIRLGELLGRNSVHIFEKGAQVLSKVKVSGGGRCNVTHYCYDPRELVKFYPRGNKELLGPFYKFGPANTIDWFAQHNVRLNTEEDGRMFPSTNSSQTIIDTFITAAEKYEVALHLRKGLVDFAEESGKWRLYFSDQTDFICDAVYFAPGSSQSLWNLLASKGIDIVPPVPSLFTFNIQDKALRELSGLSVEMVQASIVTGKLKTTGPLLFTHWGVSGPAILKLSAFGARLLNERNYNFEITINFLPEASSLAETLQVIRKKNHRKQTGSHSPFSEIPKRLWHYLLLRTGIDEQQNWADISNQKLEKLQHHLSSCPFIVGGKSTFKDEFVTSGGVSLKEVNFSDYSCKKLPGIFWGGEFLDVDALTGGFNFQHAWTSAYIAAEGIAAYTQKQKGA